MAEICSIKHKCTIHGEKNYMNLDFSSPLTTTWKFAWNQNIPFFCQNNCQNAQFGPFYQFTLGLSLVFVFSHRLLNYFAENIFCSVFKTKISLFLQKKQTCFSVEFSVFVNFSEKFCKNRTFLPYFGVFRQISSRSCEKHVVSS